MMVRSETNDIGNKMLGAKFLVVHPSNLKYAHLPFNEPTF
jgi:hypothetical protein